MAGNRAGHTHIWRVISHRRDVDKQAKVLLGCLCSAVKVVHPKLNRKFDPDFWPYIQSLPHACCDIDLGGTPMSEEEWDRRFARTRHDEDRLTPTTPDDDVVDLK